MRKIEETKMICEIVKGLMTLVMTIVVMLMKMLVMLMKMLVMLMKMLLMLMKMLVMLMIDFQVPHHPLPFPTSGLWFHPLSYDSKVNTFFFIPNEIKIICFNRYELEISLLREESSFYLCSNLIPQRCRHSMQVLDEVPMIWGSCYMVYTMHMVGIIS